MNDDEERHDRWQAGFARTLNRLRRRRRREADDQPELTPTRAYNEFRDRLMAAGYARALTRPDREVQRHLRLAGEAAIVVFRWHGTTIREVTSLPSLETEHFVDDSAVNPDTFVDGYYALLGGGADERLEELCAAARASGLFDQDATEPEGVAVARALSHLTSDEPDRRDRARAALSATIGANGRWGHEAQCIDAIARGATAEFVNGLEAYEAWLNDAFGTRERSDDPTRLLSLPILGLRLLATRVE